MTNKRFIQAASGYSQELHFDLPNMTLAESNGGAGFPMADLYPFVDHPTYDRVVAYLHAWCFNSDNTKIVATYKTYANAYHIAIWQLESAGELNNIELLSVSNSLSTTLGGGSRDPEDVEVNAAGTQIFVNFTYASKIIDLATAWDLSNITETIQYYGGSTYRQPKRYHKFNDGTNDRAIEANSYFVQISEPLTSSFGQPINVFPVPSSKTTVSGNYSPSSSNTAEWFEISDDGTKIIVFDTSLSSIKTDTLQTAYDPTSRGEVSDYLSHYSTTSEYTNWPTATLALDVDGFCFGNSGTKLFTVSITYNKVLRHSLDSNTAWDLSSGVTHDTGQILDHSGDFTTTVTNMYFDNTGTKLHLVTSLGIHRYNLSTAWSLSSATYDNHYSFSSSFSTGSSNFSFNGDGTYLIGAENNNNQVPYFNAIEFIPLTTAWDISSADTANAKFVSLPYPDIQSLGKNIIFGANNQNMLFKCGLSSSSSNDFLWLSTQNGSNYQDYDNIKFLYANTNTSTFWSPFRGQLTDKNTLYYGAGTEYGYDPAPTSQLPFCRPRGVAFNDTGTKLFIWGEYIQLKGYFDERKIYFYSTSTLSTAYDLSSVTSTSIKNFSFMIGDASVNPTSTFAYSDFADYPFQDGASRAHFCSSNGDLYISHTRCSIYRVKLSTDYDVSTYTDNDWITDFKTNYGFSDNQLEKFGEDTNTWDTGVFQYSTHNLRGLGVNSDGDELFLYYGYGELYGNDNGILRSYSLTTDYDIKENLDRFDTPNFQHVFSSYTQYNGSFNTSGTGFVHGSGGLDDYIRINRPYQVNGETIPWAFNYIDVGIGWSNSDVMRTFDGATSDVGTVTISDDLQHIYWTSLGSRTIIHQQIEPPFDNASIINVGSSSTFSVDDDIVAMQVSRYGKFIYTLMNDSIEGPSLGCYKFTERWSGNVEKVFRFHLTKLPNTDTGYDTRGSLFLDEDNGLLYLSASFDNYSNYVLKFNVSRIGS